MYTFLLHRSTVTAKHRMFPTLTYLRCSLLCLQKHTSFQFQVTLIQSTSLHSTFLRSKSILPFHLSSYFSTGLFPTCLKKITWPSKFPQTCCMSYPSDSHLVYLRNKPMWRLQIVIPSKQPFHHTQPSSSPFYFPATSMFFFFTREWDQESHPHKTQGKTAV